MVDNYALKKLYILKGGSGVGKSTFIKKFSDAFQPTTTEFIMCSADPESYDGVILHDLGVAMIDGTFPHIVDPKFPGLVDEIIDLSQFLDPTKIKATRDELSSLMSQKTIHFKSAYAELHSAREVHKQIEAIMSSAMDFSALDKIITSKSYKSF